MKEVKSLYRILAQTETVTMSATTSIELTEKEAREVGEKEVLAYFDKNIYQMCRKAPRFSAGDIRRSPSGEAFAFSIALDRSL